VNEVTTSVLGARAVIETRAAGDARARGAYARADALVPSGPVRAIDPTRPRFPAVDGKAAKPEDDGNAVKTQDGGNTARVGEAAARFTQSDNGAAAPPTDDGSQQGARGPGLLGALTNFLARVFGQSGDGDNAAPSSVLSGLRTYARNAAVMTTEPTGVEVSSPGFPRLSSGRALDLTV
jgi:hypothetical protein